MHGCLVFAYWFSVYLRSPHSNYSFFSQSMTLVRGNDVRRPFVSSLAFFFSSYTCSWLHFFPKVILYLSLQVVRAKKKDTGNVYALKIMDKKFITKENKISYVKLERIVLDQLDHPGIIRLFFTFQDTYSLCRYFGFSHHNHFSIRLLASFFFIGPSLYHTIWLVCVVIFSCFLIYFLTSSHNYTMKIWPLSLVKVENFLIK